MSVVRRIKARRILDSRGFPTVQADVTLAGGICASAAVPSGASTGSHEALELRDGGREYLGKDIKKALKNIAKIEKLLKGFSIYDLQKIDRMMIAADGTENKSKLGANAMLAVSMAAARAGALQSDAALYKYIRKVYGLKHKNYILPAPMLNIINGGKHADSGIDVQEFMIVPTGIKKFGESLRASVEIYHHLKKLLKSKNHIISVGDEGGFAPKIARHNNVLKMIMDAIRKAGYGKKQISLALDCAASEFYSGGSYKFENRKSDYKRLTRIYAGWVKKYPIISIEDPLSEDDWQGWKYLTAKLGSEIKIIGDDLFVTSCKRLAYGIENKSANAILIKLNQIGTVSETMEVIANAQNNGFSTVISHRSGETEDTFIADLAVAVNAGAIKTGAPARSERTCKYNRLLRIEEELGGKAKYAGMSAFE